MGKSLRFAVDYQYVNAGWMVTPSKQSDKFKEAARELEADEDEQRWEEKLKRVAKAKPEENDG